MPPKRALKTPRIKVLSSQKSTATDFSELSLGPSPSFKTEIETLDMLLGDLKNIQGENIVNDSQIKLLQSLRLENHEPFFSLDAENRNWIYNIISALYTLSFNELYESLTTKTWSTREQYFFSEFPLLEYSRQKQQIDINNITHKTEVSKGSFKCKICGSERVISMSSQTRKADEAQTIKNTCAACGNKWTE